MDDYLNRPLSTCLISFAALSWAMLLGVKQVANCQPLDPKYETREVQHHQLTPPTAESEAFFIGRSEELMKLDCLTEAEASVNHGLELYPKSSNLYAARSAIRVKLRRRSDALDDLATAISLDPTRGENYAARIELEKGHPEHLHVISDFDKLIELIRNPSYKLNYMLMKATYLHDIGDLTSAARVLSQCVSYAPHDARAYRLMSSCCAELRQNDIDCPDCEKFAKTGGN